MSNTTSLSRANVRNSVVGGKTPGESETEINGADIRDSNISSTEVRRCSLISTRVERSKLRRATLKECDVEDCIILRTEFKGMKLRNGVWKNGRLVGCVEGKGEVVAVSLVGSFPFLFVL